MVNLQLLMILYFIFKYLTSFMFPNYRKDTVKLEGPPLKPL